MECPGFLAAFQKAHGLRMEREMTKLEYQSALAGLRISENSPVRWEIATRPGEDEATGHGYCVDSATGCFMDADAAFWAAKRTEHDEEFFEDQMTYTDTWGWVNVASDHSDAANVVAFTSGWGDGGYLSFFGYDATGKPACLITDFGVLEAA